MPFTIRMSRQGQADFDEIRGDKSQAKRFKAVSKCIRLLVTDLRHPGLRTHKFDSLRGENGEEIFEAYAENKTPGAFRVFWHYGPNKSEIRIVAITPHP